MKSLFIKLFSLTASLLILNLGTACNDEIESNDNYYIKYIIRGNGAYGRFSNWTVSTPDGNYTNNGIQVRSWNQTYGPVNRGFRCNVQINDYISGTPSIEIHVSKNDEPFTLKANRNANTCSYTIDF